MAGAEDRSDARVGATPADIPGPPRVLVVAFVAVAAAVTALSLAHYAGAVHAASSQGTLTVGSLRTGGGAVAPP